MCPAAYTPEPTPHSLPLNFEERRSLMHAGALALNAVGREVLVGLDADESLEYLEFLRAPATDEAGSARHQALTLRMERARLQRAAEVPERGTATTQAAHDI